MSTDASDSTAVDHIGDADDDRALSRSQLQHLLDAIVLVSSDLDLGTMLRRLVEAAAQLADARYGALGVLDPSRTKLAEFITVGMDDDTVAAIGHDPEGRGLLGLLIVDPHPLRLDSIQDHPERAGFPPNHPTMTTFLGVPIYVRGEAFGNLYLCDRRTGGPFTELDEQLVTGLAAAAGVAVEHARLQASVRELGVLADRERIARDLHDTVIQRLFATGLALQSIAVRLSDTEMRDRLQRSIEDLDDTVRHIRTTIFDLQARRIPGRSVRQDVLTIVAEAAESLGFDPVVRFDGPLDLALPGPLADHALACVREILSNVVKHAGATWVDVELALVGNELRVTVTDDGVGLGGSVADDEDHSGHGLVNLRGRADQLGGSVELGPGRAGRAGPGTEISWIVPVPPG